ncbi:MAG: DUF4234 domain-containing protein [Thermoplasmatota archaeon]
MVKVLALRCPRCTARFEVNATEAKRLETCPACGVQLPPAPASWAARPDLQEMIPGVAEELTGAPRKTWKVVTLSLVTLGIYAFVYNFVAFDELDRQHRRRHATGLYLAGLLAVLGVAALAAAPVIRDPNQPAVASDVPFLFDLVVGLLLTACVGFTVAYFVRELGAVQGYRKARGLDAGIAPGWFLLMDVVPIVGWAVAAGIANESIRELWIHIYNEKRIRIPIY